MQVISEQLVGWNPATRTWSTQRDEPGTVPLPERLIGRLAASDEWLNWAADDWGHLVHYRPRAVCIPTAPEDVAALLQWSSAQALTVAPRGGAHSLCGQGQASGGIVLDMSSLDAIEEVFDGRMTVQAGALWAKVLDTAVKHRRTPPVLTDYLSTSVGGTLSGGGVGGASHQWGFQVDQVLALEVATPQGKLQWCTHHRNRDLFDAVRCGHGQIGVITRAVLVLAEAPEQVCWRRLYYPDLPTYLADQRKVAAEQRFDYLEGQVQPTDHGGWSFMMEAVSYGAESSELDLTTDLRHEPTLSTIEVLDYIEFADRMGPAEAVERASGAWLWPHPCATAFVPDSTVLEVTEDTLKQVSPADVGIGGVVLLYPILTEATGAPLLRLPHTEIAWLLGLQRKAAPDNLERLEAWTAGNREFLQRTIDADGYAYQVNAVTLTPDDWRAHYGERWAFLETAKREHDPGRVLTPGQRIFTQLTDGERPVTPSSTKDS